MKKLKFIIIALVAILGFNNCSNEFNNDKNKKLIEYSRVDENNATTTIVSFSYDDKGRLVSAVEESLLLSETDSTFSSSVTYIWDKDAVKVIAEKTEDDDTPNYTIKLKKGRFANTIYDDEPTNEDYIYEYNSNKNLLIRYGDIINLTLTWNADKIISNTLGASGVNLKYKYTYDNISCVKGYCPNVLWSTFDYIEIAHPELAGLVTKQCPISAESVVYIGDEIFVAINATFEYEFNEDGYISKIKEYSTSEDGESNFTYTLTWE